MKTKRTFLDLLMILAILLSVMVWSPEARPASAHDTAAFWYVKPGTSGNCSSWATACSLATALTQAAPGDEIWVANGTHYPVTTAGDQRLATFQLKNGVAVYGGFAGTESTRGQRDPSAHTTILSGDIGALNNTGDNSYHVVTANGTDATAILDGVTITGGNANGADPHNNGGGLYNNGGSPTLTNITFSANTASFIGGGMYNWESSPTLANVTFSANSAEYGGGMASGSNSSPTLTNVTFSNNSASSTGGGMNNDGGNPVLTHITFSGNSAWYGGGMVNYLSSLTMTHVTFYANTATNGGGMSIEGGNPALIDATFSANTASFKGGGMYNNGGMALTNVTFSANSAPNGGGIYNNGISSVLTNVTFSANTADYGGGIYNNVINPVLTNVTFSANTAISGGGLYNKTSNPTLTNAILWGNTPDQIYNALGSVPVITYSDIQDWPSGGTGNLNSNPLLGPLGNNGGFSQTHALLPGSPAIDSGSPDICPTTDQRGISRPVDGDIKNGPRCDMGSVEFVLMKIFLPQVRR